MTRTVIIIALAATMLSGCGGGGGTGMGIIASPPQAASPLPPTLTGDWVVRDLGLPGDRVSVQADGQVVVATSASRGTVTIGSCAPDGAMDLNGSWTSDGVGYAICGSGAIDPSSESLTLCATVTSGNTSVCRDARVTGVRAAADGYDTPPAPPDDSVDEPGGNPDTPPPPPDVDSSDSSDRDLPPPPPSFD